jgi:uncharacterized protein (TIGR01777 family)
VNLLVTGSSGLIGSALVASFRARGHEVLCLRRGRPPGQGVCWDPDAGLIDLGDAPPLDAVIHLAGHNIAAGRWTAARKARILDSRVKGTRLLAAALAGLTEKPRTLISGSAIGYYGDGGDQAVDEGGAPGQGFLSSVCQQWEAATKPAAVAGIRVVHARLGMVLSVSGGALTGMLPLFRMGLGGVIGRGNQYMSWVSLHDVVGMVDHILATPSLHGPVNLVSPNPVTNRQFTVALAKALRRPAVLPVPAFLVRLVLGEMADALLLASARVMPRKLNESGYRFVHSGLDATLQGLLGVSGHPAGG